MVDSLVCKRSSDQILPTKSSRLGEIVNIFSPGFEEQVLPTLHTTFLLDFYFLSYTSTFLSYCTVS